MVQKRRGSAQDSCDTADENMNDGRNHNTRKTHNQRVIGAPQNEAYTQYVHVVVHAPRCPFTAAKDLVRCTWGKCRAERWRQC